MFGIAESEYAVPILSPAFHPAAGRHRAGVKFADVNIHRLDSAAQIHKREVVAHLVRIVAPVFRVAESASAGGVLAPAFDPAIGEQRAGDVFAITHTLHLESVPQIEERQRRRCLARTIAVGFGVTDADHPEVVAAPASGPAAIRIDDARTVGPGIGREGERQLRLDGGSVA